MTASQLDSNIYGYDVLKRVIEFEFGGFVLKSLARKRFRNPRFGTPMV